MNPIQVIDQFLPQEDFKKLEMILTGRHFPWYLQRQTDYQNDGKYQFTHMFFDDHVWVGNKEIVDPFLKYLNPFSIRRIKANLQPPTAELTVNSFHVDLHNQTRAQVVTGIFYVNTNDGKTIFKTGEEINSLANRMVLFDHGTPHTGTTCTGDFPRIVLNFNYVCR